LFEVGSPVIKLKWCSHPSFKQSVEITGTVRFYSVFIFTSTNRHSWAIWQHNWKHSDVLFNFHTQWRTQKIPEGGQVSSQSCDVTNRL